MKNTISTLSAMWRDRNMDPTYTARRTGVTAVAGALAAAVVMIPAAIKGDNVLWNQVAVCSTPISPDNNGEISSRAAADASASIGYQLVPNAEDYADGVFSEAVVDLAKQATDISQSGTEAVVCFDAGKGVMQRGYSSGGAMNALSNPYVSPGLPKGEVVEKVGNRTFVDIPG